MPDEPQVSEDEQAIHEWATRQKISPEALKFLVKDGFTSLQALELLEQEDLSPKIPRGQQRLIMQAVRQLKTPQPAATPQSPPDEAVSTQEQPQHEDPYVTAVLSGLQTAQLNPAPTTTSPPAATAMAGQSQPTNLSWNDPQVFLRMAAGKASPVIQYYDIVDFANLSSLMVREEVVANGARGAELVLRDGPRKPKLSALSLPQWSVANLAILSKLQEDGKLDAAATLDYLSYSIRLYQLFQRYDQVSVYLFDREYRKLQAQMGFRWGTEVGHLQQVWLKEQGQHPTPNSGFVTKTQKSNNPTTADGQTICKLFNTKEGCSYTDCKFEHVCSRKGCEKKHPAVNHDAAKN